MEYLYVGSLMTVSLWSIFFSGACLAESKLAPVPKENIMSNRSHRIMLASLTLPS